MILDLEYLERLQSQGLVKLVKDPISEGKLSLANYTHKAQFSKAFDEHPILLDCRGIIYESSSGSVVAKPFKKFFNLNEHVSTQEELLTTYGTPEITEKVDGSMITMFLYDNKIRFATRGSFTSEQAIEAESIWNDKYQKIKVSPARTYIFEIIYPSNRIVVDYGSQRDLILIGLVTNNTLQGLGIHEELKYAYVSYESHYLGLKCVDALTAHDSEGFWPQMLKNTQCSNFEGWVLHYPDRQLKVKIKLEEYLRLHRLMNGLNEWRVWDVLRTGGDLDEGFHEVSEEIKAWISETSQELNQRFSALRLEAESSINNLRMFDLDPRDKEQRAKLAHIILRDHERSIVPAIFSGIDGKNYDQQLWKLLEPRKDSKPIKMLEEES